MIALPCHVPTLLDANSGKKLPPDVASERLTERAQEFQGTCGNARTVLIATLDRRDPSMPLMIPTDPNHRPRRRGAPGYMLLEVVLSLAVIAVFLAAIGGVLISSHNAFVETMATSATEEMASRALDRIVWELRFAPLDTVSLAQSTNSPAITYSKVQGWNASAPVLSAPQTISFGSGRILLNGVPVADTVKSLTFNRNGNGNAILVVLEVEKSVKVGGATRVISRRVETTIPF
jgi:type II secretory pathway pseudopilin PulG